MAARGHYLGQRDLDAAAIAALPEAKPTGAPVATDYILKHAENKMQTMHDEIVCSAEFTGGTNTTVTIVLWYYFGDDEGWQPSVPRLIYSPEQIANAPTDAIGGMIRYDGVGGATHARIQVLAAGGTPTDISLHARAADHVQTV